MTTLSAARTRILICDHLRLFGIPHGGQFHGHRERMAWRVVLARRPGHNHELDDWRWSDLGGHKHPRMAPRFREIP